jgi:hypothetical protein
MWKKQKTHTYVNFFIPPLYHDDILYYFANKRVQLIFIASTVSRQKIPVRICEPGMCQIEFQKARSFPEREREARKRKPKLARKARMRNAKARRDTSLM